MLRNCPAPFTPTIEQLQQFRRTGRVKVDVMKSASKIVARFEPTSNTVALHDSMSGEILGYGERFDLSKSSVVQSSGAVVSKSAHLKASDPNRCFDDSPLLPFFNSLDMSEVVAKSADLEGDDSTAELMGIFPLWLQDR